MRWSACLAALVLSGCAGVTKYLPSGPVVSAAERATYDPSPSGVSYTSEPSVPFPVLPIQVWGAHYDLDLVLESTHDRYDMHEYARVTTPEGPLWLAKDALSATKTQSLIADVPDLHEWMPELPITRRSSPVVVDDRSTDEWLDLTIRYDNLEGEPVVVTYEGKPPRTPNKKRNGNTMGHSADVVMAVLNIPAQDFAKRASITIDGEDYNIRRLLGLVGLKVALVQTQGGLSVTRFTQRGDADGFSTTVPTTGGDVEQAWTTTDHGDTVEVRQQADFRTLSYTFLAQGGALELARAQVIQHAIPQPILTLTLDPALPDLRRRFDGHHTSRFVVDVDDQPGHAIGELEAFWEGDQAVVLLHPVAPDWVTDRPMRSTIDVDPDADPPSVHVEIERTPEP